MFFSNENKKVDELNVKAVKTPNKLYISEAMLEVTKELIALLHRFDAEVEFSNDCQEELTNPQAQSTKFHASASTTKAALSSLTKIVGRLQNELMISQQHKE